MAFPRAADATSPYSIDLEPVSVGRTFACFGARAIQGDRTCGIGTVLLDVTADSVIAHSERADVGAGPDGAVPFDMGVTGRDLRIVDGAYTGDPDAPVGPPELDALVRFDTVPDDPAIRWNPGSKGCELRRGHARHRRRQGHLQAVRDLEHARLRQHLASRLGRRVVAEVQQPAARRAGPRPTPPGCRSCRACCAGRRSATAPSTTPSASPPPRPAATTCGRPGTTPAPPTPWLPADGRALPARGRVLHRRLRRQGPRGHQGDEDVRPGPRRQRLRVVLPGRAEQATGRPVGRGARRRSPPRRSWPSTPRR